jgi:C4-dicarboxylate-specific signal transduction histidine kinase
MMVALHLTADAPQHVPAIQALMTTLAITGLTIGVLIDERERSARHLSLQQDAIARATRAGSLGELATAIAHELNQPLTAANNYSRAMVAAIERHPPDLDAARLTGRKAAEQIGRSASIVVGLRDYIRAGRLETGAHELAGLVDESVALMQPEADRAGVRIEVYIPRTVPKLAVDPLKIEQVLINLIRNALEAIAGSPPADPCITISASRIVEGGVEVVVADNGPGFPPGFRLGNTRPVGSTKIDGLGIGLGFCLSIIESHGGRLELRPAAHGANVRFTLPIADGRYDEP